ncbi:UNVERIFIED_CONTAM: hypothetical protein Sradi_6899800 [Sesamum radiatum]|uniref:Uncharacterized protein n=1 Tax=Sesamum radiatum TaxID=300843 RepID=A0AAW2JIY2_SESRA
MHQDLLAHIPESSQSTELFLTLSTAKSFDSSEITAMDAPNVCRCSYPTKEAKYLQIPFPLKWTPVFLDFLSRFLLKAAKYLLPLIFLKAAKHLQRVTKAAKKEKAVGWVFDDGITGKMMGRR